jgi:hypothetical protein
MKKGPPRRVMLSALRPRARTALQSFERRNPLRAPGGRRGDKPAAAGCFC